MKVFIASDHAGFELKAVLSQMLLSDGHDVVDCGPAEYAPSDDYPLTIKKVPEMLTQDPEAFGIVIGGSGEGEAMECNRYKGVRAVVYYGGSIEIVRLSREHNNANVLSLAARFLNQIEAQNAVREWLATPFSGDERHVRRIAELDL